MIDCLSISGVFTGFRGIFTCDFYCFCLNLLVFARVFLRFDWSRSALWRRRPELLWRSAIFGVARAAEVVFANFWLYFWSLRLSRPPASSEHPFLNSAHKMPSAAAVKVEKPEAQAPESPGTGPLKQAMVILEHKIRNMEKRKVGPLKPAPRVQ